MKHGTLTAYKRYACRCADCTAANTRHHKAYRLRQLRGQSVSRDATGTRRRIQALVALGWNLEEIAQACGRKGREWPREVMGSTYVFERTAVLIENAYDHMSMTIPTGAYRGRNRLRAQRNGWPPPLAWDDIDDPNESPRPATLTAAKPIREQVWETPDHAACPRCGVVREVRYSARRQACSDCRKVAA